MYRFPLRICVEAGFPDNILLQIDCVGYKTTDRQTMHVQGLSHWAPANIGPYSQAVKVFCTLDEDILYIGCHYVN